MEMKPKHDHGRPGASVVQHAPKSILDAIGLDELSMRGNQRGNIVTGLKDALKLVNDKWFKGKLFKFKDDIEAVENVENVCMLGALIISREMQKAGWTYGDVATTYVERALLELYNFDGNIAEWNDHPARTKEEVEAVLTHAVKLAEADEAARVKSMN